ncbi:MAG: pyridoxal phosphate-dependent aminotransferase [Muribaculaceae bacterium]|nr:pyridoxal phosphate-dependent aminotransferase [Muribaculaceae bacterium]
MAKIDFDIAAPRRRGSGSYKWDSQAPGGVDRADIIPLWVADMDFYTAPCIIEALRRRVDHGVFGYTLVPDSYYQALSGWFSRRHGYTIRRESVIYVPGVVPAISAIIKALTHPGDGVIVQTPVYNCFFSSIRNNGCSIVRNPLVRKELPDGSFTFVMDFASLERLAHDPANRILLLCNPHNPVGRAWTRTELEEVARICRRHGVTVVSDEIHCDLTLPGHEFVSYGSLASEYTSEAIICNSPSKAFNTAGLQIANIVCGNESLRTLVDRAVNDNEVCDVNPFGVAGLIAAYTEGEEWLTQLVAYLNANWQWLSSYLRRELPFLPFAALEATYLAWVDVSSLGIPSEELENLLVKECGVWLNAGEMYGDDGYMRINFACPRARLVEAMERLTPVLKRLHGC